MRTTRLPAAIEWQENPWLQSASVAQRLATQTLFHMNCRRQTSGASQSSFLSQALPKVSNRLVSSGASTGTTRPSASRVSDARNPPSSSQLEAPINGTGNKHPSSTASSVRHLIPRHYRTR